MLHTIFATKQGMSQVWTKDGRRLPVTKLKVDDNVVIGKQKCVAVNNQYPDNQPQPCLIFEIGYGKKKLKNTPKPLRKRIEQSGFSFGVKQVRGVKLFLSDQENSSNQSQDTEVDSAANRPQIGDTLDISQILSEGDVIKAQGVTKGRGFTGVVKHYKFAGGPRTHGQRDRERSPGSIGAMTYPGRVWKGKKMPGHYGVETRTVSNLTVLYINPEDKELWISGPVPGHRGSVLKITTTGKTTQIELDEQASGITRPEPIKDKTTDSQKVENQSAADDSKNDSSKTKESKKDDSKKATAKSADSNNKSTDSNKELEKNKNDQSGSKEDK